MYGSSSTVKKPTFLIVDAFFDLAALEFSGFFAVCETQSFWYEATYCTRKLTERAGVRPRALENIFIKISAILSENVLQRFCSL